MFVHESYFSTYPPTRESAQRQYELLRLFDEHPSLHSGESAFVERQRIIRSAKRTQNKHT